MTDESVTNNDWCKNDDALVAHGILPTTAIFQQFRLTFVDNSVRADNPLRGRQEHPTRPLYVRFLISATIRRLHSFLDNY